MYGEKMPEEKKNFKEHYIKMSLKKNKRSFVYNKKFLLHINHRLTSI